MKHFIKSSSVLVLSLFLSACGGGGNEQETGPIDVIDPNAEVYIFDRNGNSDNPVTETVYINDSGEIDLKEYLFPPQNAQLNYRFIKKIRSLETEYEEDQSEDIIHNENLVTLTRFIKVTNYTILNDRIRLIKSDTDTFEVSRDSALGRYYNVGDLVYSVKESHPESSSGHNGINSSYPSFESEKNCRISNSVSSLTKRNFNYTGDIIELECNLTGSLEVSNSLTGTVTQNINEYQYTYYKKGVGEIATIEDHCTPQNPLHGFYGNYTSGCEVNAYTYTFLLE